jgi:O-antigen biosynthesis protein
VPALKDELLPHGTKRRLLVELLLRAAANPIAFVRHFRWQYAPRFLYHLRKTNASALEQMVNNVLEVRTPGRGGKLTFDIPNPEEMDDPIQIKEIAFPLQTSPLVSIIVPTYNRWKYAYFCLKSIFENTGGASYEVIVANDSSTDWTANMLKKIDGIKTINNERNLGFLMNCNNASLFASGKYILFLNDDVYVTKRWLEGLLEIMRREDVGAVGSKLINPDGTLQEAGGIICSDGSGWNYGRGDDPEKPEFNYVKEVDYCTGACLLVRRELFERVGRFDRRYEPAYYEETDLCFSLRNLGCKTIYQPASVVVHFDNKTQGKVRSNPAGKHKAANRVKFLKKWDSALARQCRTDKDYFLARDRSQARKVMLIIDDRVPEYDKRAGDFLSYHQLKILVDEDFKIIFLPEDLRQNEPYSSELQRMGIETIYGQFDFDPWIRKYGKYIHVVWLSKPGVSMKYLEKVKKWTKAGIVHDASELQGLEIA